MASKFALALTLALGNTDAAVVGRGQAFLGNGMQPEVVARTLSNVEDEWKAQAAVFAECASTDGLPGASIVNCKDAPSSFGKSCNTVVSAIIQGSGGDKDVAKEYMDDVCSQKSISGWHQIQCNSLALAVRGAMSSDKYANRMGFDSVKLCGTHWTRFLDGEKQRMSQDKTDREAEEKKAADEAAEQEKQFEEDRKKEADRKKVEEAEHAKEEAKAKAEEAAARVVQKKAEAEVVQEAAKKKMQEAEAAESESKKAATAAKPAEAKADVKPVAAKAPPAPVAAPKAPAAPKAAEPAAAKPAAAKAPEAKAAAPVVAKVATPPAKTAKAF